MWPSALDASRSCPGHGRGHLVPVRTGRACPGRIHRGFGDFNAFEAENFLSTPEVSPRRSRGKGVGRAPLRETSRASSTGPKSPTLVRTGRGCGANSIPSRFERFQRVARRRISPRHSCGSSGGVARGQPRAARVPHLVGSRLPSPYHFRARIQSFQAVAAPFPGNSVFAVRPSRGAIPARETPRFGEIARGSGAARRGGAASLAQGIWASAKP